MSDQINNDEGAKPYQIDAANAYNEMRGALGHHSKKRQAAYLTMAEKAAQSGAETDALTQLLNREGLNSRLTQLYYTLKRATNENPDLKIGIAIYFFDLNSLKVYNDTYGHPEGNTLLKAIADRLRNVSHRPEDILGRASGDEFVLIGERQLATSDDGDGIIERTFLEMVDLRNKIELVHPLLPKGTVTFSIGRETLTIQQIESLIATNTDPDKNLLDLVIEAADKTMYLAKKVAHETGRNEFASSGSPR